MIEIIFLRHAQATHNVAALTRGDAAYNDPTYRDAELTEEGHLQAVRLRESVVFEPDVIYCSPLRRCRQTILEVFPASNKMPVQLDDRLMEPQSHVCNHRVNRTDLEMEIPATWTLDNVAEMNPAISVDSVVKRLRAWTADIVERHKGQTVLVVTHYTWIQNWFRIFQRRVVEPANCECLVVRITV
jgi:broad specificity phosphatase PhoE